MSTSLPATGSFRAIFCAQYGVAPDLYGPTVLRLTLYPHARWLADMSSHEFLSTDRHFVASVGRLTRWRRFEDEVVDFQSAPANGHFWRQSLRLRVSVDRMRILFSDVMGGTTSTMLLASPQRNEARCESDSLAPG